MNGFSLFSGKFAAAELPEVHIPRQALLSRFHRGAGKRVIFVSAPAGYGKTVSTMLWLADSGRETIWIGLDRYDNTPSIFYKLLCSGILSIQPDNKLMESILMDPAFSLSPVEHTIRFLSEFQLDGKQYALVLDNTHLIINEEIRKSGILVGKRLPSSFVTLILSRNAIDKELTASLGKGTYSIITAQDLVFSAEEIRSYFDACGRFINMEEAQAVYSVTNGWAIGVNALALSGQIKLGQSGGRILDDYISTHFWDKWDDELRRFMLQTAIVDTMSPELANRLTDRKDSLEVFEKLCAQNFFISRVTKDTYSYHPLFLDFLRSIQSRNGEPRKSELYGKAADYYSEKGDMLSARHYAIRSGDPESIINSYILINTGESVSLDEYVSFYTTLLDDPIPEEVCNRNPYIYATYVWYYFLIGDAQRAERYLDLAYGYLPVVMENFTQFIEFAFIFSIIDYRKKLSEIVEWFQFFPDMSAPDDQLKGISLTMQLPFAHRTLRDYHELINDELFERLSDAFEILLKPQGDVAMSMLRSGVLYERNLLHEALDITLQAKRKIVDGTKDEIVFCTFMQLAAIYSALGDASSCEATVEQLEQYIEEKGFRYLQPNLMAYKTRALLMDCDKAAAKAWLDNYYDTEKEQFYLYKTFQHFTSVRAYIVLSQTDKASYYIAKLKNLGEDFRRPLDIAEASVLQAALEWALGDRTGAISTLESALIAMQEYEYIRVFADEGAAILPILKKLSLKIKNEKTQVGLSAKYLGEVTFATYEQSKRHKGITASIRMPKQMKLSAQQRNIVTLLSQGYKNAEIVEITGLTIHTVKSHCAAAYAKLGVNSAMDAVLKARELGFI